MAVGGIPTSLPVALGGTPVSLPTAQDHSQAARGSGCDEAALLLGGRNGRNTQVARKPRFLPPFAFAPSAGPPAGAPLAGAPGSARKPPSRRGGARSMPLLPKISSSASSTEFPWDSSKDPRPSASAPGSTEHSAIRSPAGGRVLLAARLPDAPLRRTAPTLKD